MNDVTVLPPGVPALITSEVINASTTRRINDIIGGPYVTHQGMRDMSDVFGYPATIDVEDYFKMYERHGVATRLTRGIARSCWRDVPKIMQGDKEIMTDVLQALESIKLFRRLEQADTLNRIARFSVLFVGVPDGAKSPDEPLGRVSNAKAAMKATYFKAYREDGVEVTQYDTDVTSPRYGAPLMYQLRVVEFADSKIIANLQTINVHYTRIVHLAEDALDNDFVGMSALEPIYNFVIDLIKAQGGSAEAYWRNARRILALTMKDSIPNTPDGIKMLADLRESIAEFTNGMADALRLGNMDVTQLTADLADPKETILGTFKMISAATGIPLRILTGEGGGQTSGNEDKAAYNQIIKDRQEMMCSDWLRQVLTILGVAGYFDPIPLDAVIEWPVNESLNELQQSETQKNKAQAVALISSAINDMGGLSGIVGGEQLLLEIMNIVTLGVFDDTEDDDADIAGLPGVPT